MRELDINEVARRCGVPASTLRFYDEKGLIKSVGRRGLRRVFDATVVERLALIALGRAAGFSLDEIAQMFDPSGRPRIDRQMLSAKADDLDDTIRTLTAMRDGLRHAAVCSAPSPFGMSWVSRNGLLTQPIGRKLTLSLTLTPSGRASSRPGIRAPSGSRTAPASGRPAPPRRARGARGA